jgi:hypothetical protein
VHIFFAQLVICLINIEISHTHTHTHIHTHRAPPPPVLFPEVDEVTKLVNQCEREYVDKLEHSQEASVYLFSRENMPEEEWAAAEEVERTHSDSPTFLLAMVKASESYDRPCTCVLSTGHGQGVGVLLPAMYMCPFYRPWSRRRSLTTGPVHVSCLR